MHLIVCFSVMSSNTDFKLEVTLSKTYVETYKNFVFSFLLLASNISRLPLSKFFTRSLNSVTALKQPRDEFVVRSFCWLSSVNLGRR